MNGNINHISLSEKKYSIFFLFLLLSVISVSAQKGKLKMTSIQRSGESVEWIMVDANELEIYQIYTVGENPDNLNDGLRRIVSDDKIGFIDKKGKLVIPPRYCRATPFFKGKSIVNVNAVKIDKSATDTRHATLWEGGKWGVIDKKGKVVKPFDYAREWYDSVGTYVYKKNGEMFIFTPKGKIQTFILVN